MSKKATIKLDSFEHKGSGEVLAKPSVFLISQ
jgi:hypothetical protein